MPVYHPDIRAHLLQDIEKHRNIGYLGYILYPARSLYHEGRRYYSHGGIFSAADLYLTVQRPASVNDVLCHRFTFQL